MNDQTVVEPTPALPSLCLALRHKWGWLLAIGIVLVLLGMFGVAVPFVMTETMMLYLGILLLVGGIVQLVHAFATKAWKDILLHALLGLLYIIAGVYTIQSPTAMSLILTLFIGGALVAVGIVRIVIGIRLRGVSGWFWPVLSGIIALALGIMILVKWPFSGLFVIGLFVGIELLLNGWTCIMTAFALKNLPAAQ